MVSRGTSSTGMRRIGTRDGTLYFGGSEGFNYIDPTPMTENSHAPSVALTGFHLFNKPVAIGVEGSPLAASITVTKGLVLRHDQSVFTMEFAALDYAAPNKNQYADKLEGLSEDWNHVGTQRSASYTNLDAGRAACGKSLEAWYGPAPKQQLARAIVATMADWNQWNAAISCKPISHASRT